MICLSYKELCHFEARRPDPLSCHAGRTEGYPPGLLQKWHFHFDSSYRNICCRIKQLLDTVKKIRFSSSKTQLFAKMLKIQLFQLPVPFPYNNPSKGEKPILAENVQFLRLQISYDLKIKRVFLFGPLASKSSIYASHVVQWKRARSSFKLASRSFVCHAGEQRATPQGCSKNPTSLYSSLE